MPWTTYPDFINGRYFPTEESHHRFLEDLKYGLLDDNDLEAWLAWPRAPSKTPSPTASSKLESVAEAAKRKGVSKKRIRQWVIDGKLKCVRFDDRTNADMNIVADDLDRLIDELAA